MGASVRGLRVLGIDPSSTCTGLAVVEGLGCEGLLDGVVVRPSGKWGYRWASLEKRETSGMTAWERAWLEVNRDASLPAWWRGTAMVDEVLDALKLMVGQFEPDVVAMEVSSGRAGTGSRAGGSSSLIVYGQAVGRLFEAAEQAWGGVLPVSERQWTAGQGGKPMRTARLRMLYGSRYNWQVDRGGDAADAIGLCVGWWVGWAVWRAVWSVAVRGALGVVVGGVGGVMAEGALSERAAAERLGVHPGTLLRWRQDGEAPPHFVVPRPRRNLVRYPVGHLERWMRLRGLRDV